jgi:hypothetical protein
MGGSITAFYHGCFYNPDWFISCLWTIQVKDGMSTLYHHPHHESRHFHSTIDYRVLMQFTFFLIE